MKLAIATLILCVGLSFSLSAQTTEKKVEGKAKTEVATKSAKKVKGKKATSEKSCEGKKCSAEEKAACCDKK